MRSVTRNTISINNKIPKNPVSTVTQHRLGIFRPVKQIQGHPEDILVENSWGKCKLPLCVLTQVHACIIESIFISAIKINVPSDGSIAVLFTVPDALRNMGKATRNHTWFNLKIEELKFQIIEMENKNMKIRGRIVRKFFEYKNEINQDAKVWAIVFGMEFSRFFRSDFGMVYPSYLLKVIASLPGPAQAIVRFCWSHAGGVRGETIQAILRGHLKYEWNNIRDENKCLKKIFSVSNELKKTGVIVDSVGRVWYQKKQEVWHLNPENFLMNLKSDRIQV